MLTPHGTLGLGAQRCLTFVVFRVEGGSALAEYLLGLCLSASGGHMQRRRWGELPALKVYMLDGEAAHGRGTRFARARLFRYPSGGKRRQA